MTVTYTYTRDWRTADGRTGRIVTSVHRVAATVMNRPIAPDCVLIAWDRAGLSVPPFSHPSGVHAAHHVVWDDWANPDEYWTDGKLWSWHATLVARCGTDALACFVTSDDDHLATGDAFPLADFVECARRVDSDGATIVGLAVHFGDSDIATTTSICAVAVARIAAWHADAVYEIRQRVDGGAETVVHVGYGDDDAWAATKARLAADRYVDVANGRERSRTDAPAN